MTVHNASATITIPHDQAPSIARGTIDRARREAAQDVIGVLDLYKKAAPDCLLIPLCVDVVTGYLDGRYSAEEMAEVRSYAGTALERAGLRARKQITVRGAHQAATALWVATAVHALMAPTEQFDLQHVVSCCDGALREWEALNP